MAIAAGARGEIFVLDQVNSRIARFDANGAALGNWPAAVRTARDVAIGPRGDVAVLERDHVLLLAADGKPRATIGLQGIGEDPATGVTVEPNGIWAELGHAWNVRVAGPDGEDAPREKRDGKGSRDGAWLLSAGIAEARAGTAWVRALDAATSEFRWQKRYTFPAPILGLMLLDSFDKGGIAFGAHVAREVKPGQFTDESVEVLCLASDGTVRNALSFPPPEGPEESTRDLSAAPDGAIVYLHHTRSGLRIMSASCN